MQIKVNVELSTGGQPSRKKDPCQDKSNGTLHQSIDEMSSIMLTLMTPDGVMVIPMTMLEIIWADYGDGGCDVDDDDEVVRKALVFELWLREQRRSLHPTVIEWYMYHQILQFLLGSVHNRRNCCNAEYKKQWKGGQVEHCVLCGVQSWSFKHRSHFIMQSI